MKVKSVEYRIREDRKAADVIVNGDMLISSLDVETDKEGHEYIRVLNLFRDEGSAFEKWRFGGRVGDMVETIRRGWGDVIAPIRRSVAPIIFLRCGKPMHSQKGKEG